jgi:hypothetical protein
MGRAGVGGIFACALALVGLHACGDTDEDTRRAPDASAGGSAGTPPDAAVETEASSGGSAGTPADSDACDIPNVTEEVACQTYGDVLCSLYEECTPVYFDQLGFASKAQCVERLALSCGEQLAGPGTLLQPGMIQVVSTSLKSTTCADLAMGWYVYAQTTWGVDAKCPYWGTLGAGEACHSTSQCMDGFKCDVPVNELCGVCAGTTLGSDCQTDADCDADLFCNSDDHCEARKNLGEPCTENTLPPSVLGGEECVADAYCHESVCVPRVGAGSPCTKTGACNADLVCGANGQCKPPALGEVGASCSPDEWLSCNIWKGLRCDPTLGCQPRPIPAPGEPCGYSATDAGTSGELYCTGGASCVWSSALNPGLCMLPAAEGDSCDLGVGPPCRYPAECVLGVCTIADATTCGTD